MVMIDGGNETHGILLQGLIAAQRKYAVGAEVKTL